MWDSLARKYGVELIEKDGTFIARKGSLEVTSKIVDDKVVVRVNTLPYTAVIQPTKDGVVNTVYLGVLPIAQVKYRVEPQGFVDKNQVYSKRNSNNSCNGYNSTYTHYSQSGFSCRGNLFIARRYTNRYIVLYDLRVKI